MSYLEERIKRTGKKEIPTERPPMSAKERLAKERPTKAGNKEKAKSVDAADAPSAKPDLASIKAAAARAT